MSMEIKPLTMKSLRRINTARLREQKLAMQKASEEKFQKFLHNFAKEIIGFPTNLRVNSVDVADFSAANTIQYYAGKLEMTDSVWAPWSKSFNKNI